MKSSFSCFILLAAAASSSLQTVYAGCWLFPSSCKAPPAPSKPATNPSPTSNNNNVSSASLTNNNNMTAAKSSSSSSSSSSGFKRVHHHNKLVQRPTPNLKNKKTGNTTTSGSNLKMGVSQPGHTNHTWDKIVSAQNLSFLNCGDSAHDPFVPTSILFGPLITTTNSSGSTNSSSSNSTIVSVPVFTPSVITMTGSVHSEITQGSNFTIRMKRSYYSVLKNQIEIDICSLMPCPIAAGQNISISIPFLLDVKGDGSWMSVGGNQVAVNMTILADTSTGKHISCIRGSVNITNPKLASAGTSRINSTSSSGSGINVTAAALSINSDAILGALNSTTDNSTTNTTTTPDLFSTNSTSTANSKSLMLSSLSTDNNTTNSSTTAELPAAASDRGIKNGMSLRNLQADGVKGAARSRLSAQFN